MNSSKKNIIITYEQSGLCAGLVLNSLKYQIMLMFVINGCVKLLLMDYYHSTDLEVHRNWMAITHNLPMYKWYTEDTSKWTLDYPPFFAYFELILSYPAKYFSPNILKISSKPICDSSIKTYMRLSVIITDLLYFYSIFRTMKIIPSKHQIIFLFSTIFNLGLLFIDSIHFQYNGFMFGILFLSFVQAFEGNYFWSAFSFAILLNFKHIFVYYAPAFGLFFLLNHCFKDQTLCLKNIHFKNLFIFVLIVISVFGLSLGPFILNGTFQALIGRLFPFGRGLTHAYWAPNFWAAYNGADIVLSKIFGTSSPTLTSTLTSGLVQQIDMKVLPNIPPLLTFLLIIITFLIYVLISQPRSTSSNSLSFRRVPKLDLFPSLAVSAATFFMFGYHVHEKAILLIVCPLCLTFFKNQTAMKCFVFLTFTGYVSLFPLFFGLPETILKWILMINYVIAFWILKSSNFRKFRLSNFEFLYFCLLFFAAFLESFGTCLFPIFFSKFQFLPLMILSIVSFVGIAYSYMLFYFF